MNDRDKEGTYIWSDGQNSSFFYWANDIESDDEMNQNEDCVVMQKTGEWRTFHCENKFYFFCKKRICKCNFHRNNRIFDPLFWLYFLIRY